MRTNTVIGVLDYKPDSNVYLSLMMIDAEVQGNCLIRIDVVNDYDENAVGFWERQGFTAKNEIKLSWGNKQSTALVMLKALI